MGNLQMMMVAVSVIFLSSTGGYMANFEEVNAETNGHPQAAVATPSETQVQTEEYVALYYLANTELNPARPTDRPMLGVHVRNADKTLRLHLGIEGQLGLVVEHITPGSAAEDCGLRVHDVLTSFDEQILESPGQFQLLVDQYQPGDQVDIEFFRAGILQSVTAELMQRPADDLNAIDQEFRKFFGEIENPHGPDFNAQNQKCTTCHKAIDQAETIDVKASKALQEIFSYSASEMSSK